MNIPPAELSALVVEARTQGKLTNKLAGVAMQIAAGYLLRKCPNLQDCERQDIVGDFCVRLVEKWDGIDPERNGHSYLTQMANYAALDYLRKHNRLAGRQVELDSMEPHQVDAAEAAMLEHEARESLEVKSSGDADYVVNPRDGQMGILFED